MNKIFILITIWSFTMYSQTTIVNYDMMLSFNNNQNYSASLIFNDSIALFKFKNEESPTELSKNEENFTFKVNDTTEYSIYTSLGNNKVIETVKGIEKNIIYKIEEDLNKIDWTITSLSKQINNFNCLKAFCRFKGRDYEVWFAPQIVSRFGPLKLHGLPGLILELYDTKKEILIFAKSIEYLNKKIEFNTNLPLITRKEYNDKIKEKINNLINSISTKQGREFKIESTFTKLKGIELE